MRLAVGMFWSLIGMMMLTAIGAFFVMTTPRVPVPALPKIAAERVEDGFQTSVMATFTLGSSSRSREMYTAADYAADQRDFVDAVNTAMRAQ